ncbi:ribosome biogenesis GTP-binding protein YihA/YsxC [Caedibacter taeniospiralis]|uniref:ribosome biogenesis GTP-binding protein YihA/YsxC n=1 Tax=Caedibacter taeniospiralis TaxID=28907 RepID=UPI000C27BCAE|nr:ribosome biogenesis GTP-binding protein YihA/YsxC [Caedibacter taeniospiralis]
MNYRNAKYLMGASLVEQLPDDYGIEVAFAGRSNAGKSSALNALTEQKKLARVSKTPGRTQLINLFTLEEHKRLVDLPGYGYAKVSEKIKASWQKTLEMYLTTRQCLKGIVLLVDSRHPIKDFDCMMIEAAVGRDLNLHVLLTKADKLKNAEKAKAERLMRDYLKQLRVRDNISFQLFSAQTGTGLEKFKQKLDAWYELPFIELNDGIEEN